jgi:asparagine synthase (glutamine-hydrolysing)
VELCWGIPLAHFRKVGETRRLARRALVGLLPDAVRLNQRRGYQAADVAPRLLDAWEDLSATLGRFAASPLVSEYLDVPRMQAEAETLRQPITPKTTSHCGALLLRAVGVGFFLLRFER